MRQTEALLATANGGLMPIRIMPAALVILTAGATALRMSRALTG